MKALVREAVALNVAGKKASKSSTRKARKPAVLPKSEGGSTRSGGAAL